jgi:hypothetical protein
MLCCVIGGAIVAFICSRFPALPVIGPHFARRRAAQADASDWRLDRGTGPRA